MACLEPFDDLLALGMKVSAEKRMDHVDRKSVQKRLHNEKKKKKVLAAPLKPAYGLSPRFLPA